MTKEPRGESTVMMLPIHHFAFHSQERLVIDVCEEEFFIMTYDDDFFQFPLNYLFKLSKHAERKPQPKKKNKQQK